MGSDSLELLELLSGAESGVCCRNGVSETDNEEDDNNSGRSEVARSHGEGILKLGFAFS